MPPQNELIKQVCNLGILLNMYNIIVFGAKQICIVALRLSTDRELLKDGMLL